MYQLKMKRDYHMPYQLVIISMNKEWLDLDHMTRGEHIWEI
jgi:hypothetical protein